MTPQDITEEPQAKQEATTENLQGNHITQKDTTG